MTREEEIKRAWANYRLPWPSRDGVPLPFLKIANYRPSPATMWGAPAATKTAPELDVFVFEREDGYHEGGAGDARRVRGRCGGYLAAVMAA